MEEKSCGTIPYTIRNGRIYYLLIFGRQYQIYGFPKGHTEYGETEEETASRETWEETSLRPELKKGFRRQVQYTLRKGKQKTVVYFVADFGEQIPQRNGNFEDYDYCILPFEKAYTVLGQNIRQILKEADAYIRENLMED